ncbi:MAG: hypothetical protein AAB869_02525 [Patescibacteria group bacterium]
MVNAILFQFEEYDRKIFWTLIFLGMSALLLYVYFLGISVVAVVAQKVAERELGRMTAQVAVLESQYVRLDGDIDLEFAHESGFVDVVVPQYITTITAGNMLTLGDGVSGRDTAGEAVGN